MREVEAPSVRSAAMKSRVASDDVSAKITRAVCTQFTSAMTRATIHSDGWKMAARQIASKSAGKAIIRSVKRIRTAPIQPRKKPAVMPTSVPINRARPFATTPMTSEVCAP